MKRNRLVFIVSALVVIGVAVGTIAWRQQGSQPLVLGAQNTPASRNAERKADLGAIKGAMVAYLASHKKLPITIGPKQTEICSSITANCGPAKLIDLNFLVASGELTGIPNDPVGGAGRYNTGFEMFRDTRGAYHLVAVRAESATISEVF